MSGKPSFTASFPASAAIIGEFRSVFGASVRQTYVEEGGMEVGTRLDESRYTVICGADLIIKIKPEGKSSDR